MIKHSLSESDCDSFRNALLDKALAAVGTPACAALHDVVDLLDQHRSDSFLRRAAATAGLGQLMPKPRKPLGLRLSR
jgi:hypothetical protein